MFVIIIYYSQNRKLVQISDLQAIYGNINYNRQYKQQAQIEQQIYMRQQKHEKNQIQKNQQPSLSKIAHYKRDLKNLHHETDNLSNNSKEKLSLNSSSDQIIESPLIKFSSGWLSKRHEQQRENDQSSLLRVEKIFKKDSVIEQVSEYGSQKSRSECEQAMEHDVSMISIEKEMVKKERKTSSRIADQAKTQTKSSKYVQRIELFRPVSLQKSRQIERRSEDNFDLPIYSNVKESDHKFNEVTIKKTSSNNFFQSPSPPQNQEPFNSNQFSNLATQFNSTAKNPQQVPKQENATIHRSILMTALKSDCKTMDELKEKMRNQKSLKLKDYLRLASLSNSSKVNSRKNSEKKIKTATEVRNNNNEHSSHHPKRLAIDPSLSINLIKTQIKKKLGSTMQQASELLQQLDNKELVGNQYEDLVFMCNIHRIFDENIFQSSKTLSELFQEYQSKKKLSENSKFMEETIKAILKLNLNPRSPSKNIARSPTKKRQEQSQKSENAQLLKKLTEIMGDKK